MVPFAGRLENVNYFCCLSPHVLYGQLIVGSHPCIGSRSRELGKGRYILPSCNVIALSTVYRPYPETNCWALGETVLLFPAETSLGCQDIIWGVESWELRSVVCRKKRRGMRCSAHRHSTRLPLSLSPDDPSFFSLRSLDL